MKKITGSGIKQTLKEAGYKYISYDSKAKEHTLLDTNTGIKEQFFANKNHASWGLKYKNTHLEFMY